MTDIHRDWNQRYVWPRFTTAVPREFFDAVRAEADSPGGSVFFYARRDRVWVPRWPAEHRGSLDHAATGHEPVYTGKDVSYSTKLGQRAIEPLSPRPRPPATLAWLAGAPSRRGAGQGLADPAYGAHHDAIPGSSPTRRTWTCWRWREARELARFRAAAGGTS